MERSEDSKVYDLISTATGLVYMANLAGADLVLTVSALSLRVSRYEDGVEAVERAKVWLPDESPEQMLRELIAWCIEYLKDKAVGMEENTDAE